jgi:hypothetical protein
MEPESDRAHVAIFIGDENVGVASAEIHRGSPTFAMVGGIRIPGRPTPDRVVLTMDPFVAVKVMAASIPVRVADDTGRFSIQPISSEAGSFWRSFYRTRKTLPTASEAPQPHRYPRAPRQML